MLVATTSQNKPTRGGQARLGYWDRTNRRWTRTFHLDVPHPQARTPVLTHHINADAGPLRFLNHTAIPSWAYPLGGTSLLRGLGVVTLVGGLVMDAYSIDTAPNPCQAASSVVGGWGGGFVGGFAGTLAAPGAGTVLGGTVGGFVGSFVGDAAGSAICP